MMKTNMDQIPIGAVCNVYLNNDVYICSGSQSPLPFLSREVLHSYRPQEKHETEVQEVHFSNTTILLRLCAMRYAHRRNYEKNILKRHSRDFGGLSVRLFRSFDKNEFSIGRSFHPKPFPFS